MRYEWTKEEICEALEAWYQKTGEIPKADHWKRSGHHEHPSYQTVWMIFGGWRKAINEWKRWRMRRDPWNREEIISAFQKWHEEHGIPPMQKDTVFNPSMPSPASVHRIFGSWNTAIEEAGFIPMPQGLTRKQLEKFLPLPRKQ